MATASILSAMFGIPVKKLIQLEEHGLEIDGEYFESDARHQKALNDIRQKRISAYALAYAYQCKVEKNFENSRRLDSIYEVAEFKGFCMDDELYHIQHQKVENEKMTGAKHWIDQATLPVGDMSALERIGRWSKSVLTGVKSEANHKYLAVRLLVSLPEEVMMEYPKKVQTTLNRTRFYGFLDGWWRAGTDEDGKKKILFYRGNSGY